MRRWMPRVLVGLTILVVLGPGGYAGQVQLAKHQALHDFQETQSTTWFQENVRDPQSVCEVLASNWGYTPWWGRWDFHPNAWRLWRPRRSYYEELKLFTKLDLGNDPSAWEAWFKAHPNLVWDAKQKRLVDPVGAKQGDAD